MKKLWIETILEFGASLLSAFISGMLFFMLINGDVDFYNVSGFIIFVCNSLLALYVGISNIIEITLRSM